MFKKDWGDFFWILYYLPNMKKGTKWVQNGRQKGRKKGNCEKPY
jgi:hypothetical protein